MKIQNTHILSGIKGEPVMITVGMFDGVHRGHSYFIRKMEEKAKKMSFVPVVITLDPHPHEILSDQEFRYLTTVKEKQELLKQLGIQHVLILQTTQSLLQKSGVEFVEDLKAAGLNVKSVAMGYNNHFGNTENHDSDINKMIKENKITVFSVDEFSEKINSTLIREKLRLGKVDDAAVMLGHPYMLYGTVVEGNKLGRTIGFPTANIQVTSVEKMIPAAGVYAVICQVGGKEFPGMMNIGYRPTLREEIKKLVLEVHVPGEKLDIYNTDVIIEFCKKIRDEKQFNDMEELKIQLEKDKNFIKSYFSDNFASYH
ncbi:MAG: riboflavin biosynthesis protein RibF [Bacteroidales bacterium]